MGLCPSRSVSTCGELPIHAHGKILVKDYRYVARADFHFTFCPRRNGGKLHAESMVQFFNHAVIYGYFSEPGAFLLQVRGHFVAQIHERVEIASANGRAVNSRRKLQRVRQRLAGGGYPDRAPLRDSKFDQSETRKHENEHCDHILLTVSFLDFLRLANGA